MRKQTFKKKITKSLSSVFPLNIMEQLFMSMILLVLLTNWKKRVAMATILESKSMSFTKDACHPSQLNWKWCKNMFLKCRTARLYSHPIRFSLKLLQLLVNVVILKALHNWPVDCFIKMKKNYFMDLLTMQSLLSGKLSLSLWLKWCLKLPLQTLSVISKFRLGAVFLLMNISRLRIWALRLRENFITTRFSNKIREFRLCLNTSHMVAKNSSRVHTPGTSEIYISMMWLEIWLLLMRCVAKHQLMCVWGLVSLSVVAGKLIGTRATPCQPNIICVKAPIKMTNICSKCRWCMPTKDLLLTILLWL